MSIHPCFIVFLPFAVSFFCLFNFFYPFFFFFFQLDFLFPPRPIDGFHTSRTRVPVELCRCTLLGKRMTARVSSIRIGEKGKKDEIIKTVLSDICVFLLPCCIKRMYTFLLISFRQTAFSFFIVYIQVSRFLFIPNILLSITSFLFYFWSCARPSSIT